MAKPTKPDRPSLADVAVAEAERLASDPNVVCVGIGLKLVRGRATLRAALQYHVRSKLASEAEVRRMGSQPVPAEVHGYVTDVIQWAMTRPMACPEDHKPTGERGGLKEDPLVGGTSTTILADFHSFPSGYGTLGGICFDTATGASMALSNAHVYSNEIGNDVIQPWLPMSEWLESSLKYLFCGGPLGHLFFWTAPTPLTDILTTLAAGAWVAAVWSDAEDPSRWGQRATAVPSPGTVTDRERIHVETAVPELPFPGRHWQAKTRWDYARHTSAGQTTGSIEAARENEHVLVGKRVFTDRDTYRGGDRVTICAQLWTRADVQPVDHFVVAHSFPIADPGRLVRRVLVPSELCARHDKNLEKLRQPHCLHGFPAQVAGLAEMAFPIVAAPFVLFCQAGATVLHAPSASGNPSGVAALRIPPSAPLNIACPPSTHVELDLYHTATRVRVDAFSANGTRIDHAETTDERGVLQKVRLTGPEIVRLVLDGGGQGYLAAVCVDKRMIDGERWKARSRYYNGNFDLALREPAGKWAVVVVAQTLDDTPAGADPVRAARRLGGIADSANVVETGECACTILFDHTFDVV